MENGVLSVFTRHRPALRPGRNGTGGGAGTFPKETMFGKTWHCLCRAKYIVSILQPGRHLDAPKSGQNQVRGPLRSPVHRGFVEEFGRGAREGRVGAPEVRRARKAARRKSGVCAGGEGGGGAKGGARPHVGAGRWRAAHRRRPTAAGCRSEHLSTVTRVCRFMIKLACTFWAYRQPRMTAIRYVHGTRARGI